MMRLSVLASLAGLATLAACSSTPDLHYYSLMPPGAATAADSAARAARGNYAIHVAPVTVPEIVDRAQIVLTDPDTTQVTPLSGYLWAAPLADEIRRALAGDLSRRLGVLAVPAEAVDTTPNWTVTMQVQRFTSIYGSQAAIQAGWRLKPTAIARRTGMYCEGEAAVPVDSSVTSLVAGHREAVSMLGALIAAQIQRGPGATAPAANAGPGRYANIKGCVAG